MHLLAPLFLFLVLVSTAHASLDPLQHNCSEHNPIFSLPNPSPDAECLHLLRNPLAEDPHRFAPCLNTTCYLFIQEAPFIILPDEMLEPLTPQLLSQYQRPFPCGKPQVLHNNLHGIAFQIHSRTTSNDSLCVWAGPISNCTFNALVDFIHVMGQQQPPYRFAITGLLLETQQRHCFHDPSAPFIENNMVIVGRATDDSLGAKGPFFALVRPFEWSTWGVFAAFVIIFVIACFIIAWRFRVFPGRSFVTAFYILAGEREEAMSPHHGWRNAVRKKCGRRPHARRSSVTRRRQSTAAALASLRRGGYARKSLMASKYGLALTLFSASVVALGAIFALFYEVAVVNFLFQQRPMALDKSVRSLSNDDLVQYAVVKDSALEVVWDNTVNHDGSKYIDFPWKRCTSGAECIEWVANGEKGVLYDVTFDILAKYLLGHDPKYKDLTLFQTKDVLYQFSAGWLYNEAVDKAFRKKVDGQLVGLRRNGQIQKIIQEATENFSQDEDANPSIGPLIVLIPLGFFVVPPLIGSILVVTCWPSNEDEDLAEGNRTSIDNQTPDSNDSKDAEGDKTSQESITDSECAGDAAV